MLILFALCNFSKHAKALYLIVRDVAKNIGRKGATNRVNIRNKYSLSFLNEEKHDQCLKKTNGKERLDKVKRDKNKWKESGIDIITL